MDGKGYVCSLHRREGGYISRLHLFFTCLLCSRVIIITEHDVSHERVHVSAAMEAVLHTTRQDDQLTDVVAEHPPPVYTPPLYMPSRVEDEVLHADTTMFYRIRIGLVRVEG